MMFRLALICLVLLLSYHEINPQKTNPAKATIGPKTTTTRGPRSTSTPGLNTDMPIVFTQPPGNLQLEKDNLLTFLKILGEEFEVSFEFKPESYNDSNFTSILHLTKGTINSSGQVFANESNGMIPAILYNPNRGLHVMYDVGSGFDGMISPMSWDMGELPLNKWTTIVVSQVISGLGANFTIAVAGAATVSVENWYPISHEGILVYAANPWRSAQSGLIRALTIKTQCTWGSQFINMTKKSPCITSCVNGLTTKMDMGCWGRDMKCGNSCKSDTDCNIGDPPGSCIVCSNYGQCSFSKSILISP